MQLPNRKELPPPVPTRRPYAIDLSREEWRTWSHLSPRSSQKVGPEPTKRASCWIHLLRCAWRLRLEALTPRFPPWQTAYRYYLRSWRIDGTRERMHAALRGSLETRGAGGSGAGHFA